MPDFDAVLRPVAWVESTLADRKDAPRQPHEGAPSAWLVFEPAVRRSMADLRAGDEVLVLTWLDQGIREVQEVQPRDDPTAPLTGVFSTRSPDRANPIGLHPCRITAIDGLRVQVDALEAIDGTPVVDVKPQIGPRPQR